MIIHSPLNTSLVDMTSQPEQQKPATTIVPSLDDLYAKVKLYPNYHGVQFQDMTALLADPACCQALVKRLCQPFLDKQIDVVVGLEARGLGIAALMAQSMGAGFAAIRKADGKLPGECIQQAYGTEYSKDAIKIGVGNIPKGARVLLVDDLLATGGTLEAAYKLLSHGNIGLRGISFVCPIELVGLNGRERLVKAVFGNDFAALTKEGVELAALDWVHTVFQFDAKTGERVLQITNVNDASTSSDTDVPTPIRLTVPVQWMIQKHQLNRAYEAYLKMRQSATDKNDEMKKPAMTCLDADNQVDSTLIPNDEALVQHLAELEEREALNDAFEDLPPLEAVSTKPSHTQVSGEVVTTHIAGESSEPTRWSEQWLAAGKHFFAHQQAKDLPPLEAGPSKAPLNDPFAGADDDSFANSLAQQRLLKWCQNPVDESPPVKQTYEVRVADTTNALLHTAETLDDAQLFADQHYMPGRQLYIRPNPPERLNLFSIGEKGSHSNAFRQVAAPSKPSAAPLGKIPSYWYSHPNGQVAAPSAAPKPLYVGGKLNLPINQIPHRRTSNDGLVFYYPTMAEVAADYVAIRNRLGRDYPSDYVSTKWRLGEINWSHFPDKTPSMLIEHKHNLQNAHIVFIGDLTQMHHFFEQKSIMQVLPKQNVRSFEIIIPFNPTGTNERVPCEGIVATADTMFKELSEGMPHTQQSCTHVSVMDIHALQERFYPTNNIQLHFDMCAPATILKQRVIPDIKVKYPGKHIAIAMPDDGARKRFEALFKHEYPVITFDKHRNGDERVIVLRDHHLPGCDAGLLTDDGKLPKNLYVILLDDLVQSGGTLAECAKALRKLGADHVGAFVTHAVFPNDSHKRFAVGGKDAGLLDNFFTTDSVPLTAEKLNLPPYKVYSCASVLARESSGITNVLLDNFKPLVGVASASELKLEAAKYGIGSGLFHMNHQAVSVGCNGYGVSSGVSEQPVGHLEIWQGCANRMANLQLDAADANHVADDWLVAMENGIIVLSDGSAKDVACVAVSDRHTQKTTFYWSQSVKVPADVWAQWKAISDEKQRKSTTIGSLLHAQDPKVSANDWMGDLYGPEHARIRLLVDAVNYAVQQHLALVI